MTPSDESPFDEHLADRVREVFEGYEEPVDEAALERLQAALGHGGAQGARLPGRAGDRPPAVAARRTRWGAPAALLAALLAVGAGLWIVQMGPSEPPVVAEATGPQARPPDRPEPTAGATAEPGPSSAAEAALSDALAAAPAAPARPPAAARQTTPRALSVRQPADDRSGDTAPSIGEAAGPPAPVTPQRSDASVQPDPSPGPAIAALPPRPSVFDRDDRRPTPPVPQPLELEPADADRERSGLRLVVATASAFADGQLVEGAGVATGVVREWKVASRVAVSGGAVAAYGRFVVEPDVSADAVLFGTLAESPGQSIEVTSQSTLTTLAIEVPLDVTVDVARAPAGQLGVSLGLTSALYLVQTFQDEGRRYTGAFVESPNPQSEADLFVVSYAPYDAQQTVGPLERLDLARQVNLGVGYTADPGAFPVSVDVYARLPLGGLTSRDLPLTTVGIRFRYALR